MYNSKWNYVFTGVGFAAVIFGVLIHDAFLVCINALGMVLNWYFAEAKRRAEEQFLLEENEQEKDEDEHDGEGEN
jgi:hypothetical protein